MPWFKVDDHFHSHPKVVAAGNAAIGLWVRCGSYSSAYLMDGHVPAAKVREMGSRRELDALTTARLWVPSILPAHLPGGGDPSFLFPDFLEYNDSAEQVRQSRANNRERQARHRASHNGSVTP